MRRRRKKKYAKFLPKWIFLQENQVRGSVSVSIFPRKSNLGGSIPSKKFAPAARANLPQRYRDAINKIFYLRTSHRLVGRKTPIQAAENTRGGRLGARAETEARLFRYVSLYYTGRVPARKEHSPKDRMFPWLTRSQQAKSGRKPSRHFTASSCVVRGYSLLHEFTHRANYGVFIGAPQAPIF